MLKTIIIATLALTPLAAQAAEPGADAAADTQAARLNLDTPISTIVADEAGKAVLDTNMPGLTTHPQFMMFKGMSLNQLSNMVPDKLTPEALAKVSAELAKIQ